MSASCAAAFDDMALMGHLPDSSVWAGDSRVGYWMWTPLMARAMISRWISEVPSKIV